MEKLNEWERERVLEAIELIETGVERHSCMALMFGAADAWTEDGCRLAERYAEFYGFSCYGIWRIEDEEDPQTIRVLLLALFLEANT